MGLPATIAELRQLLSDLRLVSEAEFLRVIPGSPDLNVQEAVSALTQAPASWADAVPNEPLLTSYQLAELTSDRGATLCCDHWRIRNRVGDGGMGTVFSARDLRTDRFAAIKFFKGPPNPLDVAAANQRLERFEREIHALLGLRHSGVPLLLDRGVREGIPFFAMEYVRGKTLKEVAEATHVDFDLATNWFLQLAEIVCYMHENGYIHRDIKPENIVVTEADGRIVFLDLGLCLRVNVPQPQITFAPCGTPEYMAPEIWQTPHPADAFSGCLSDIYSLGCTFFFVLTGVPPFRGTIAQLGAMHAREPAPRVSSRRPDCPGLLDDVIARMLAKDPNERILSAQQLKSALLGTSPTLLATPSSDGIAQDEASVRLELSMAKFEHEVRRGLVRLRDRFVEVRESAIRDLERGHGTWADLNLSTNPGTLLPTRLIELGELLEFIEAAFDVSWSGEFRGPEIDNLSRHYTSILIYVVDYLTEDRLAQARSARFWLLELHREIESRLVHWSEALMGHCPYGNDLDQELCRSLKGPYHRPLALVVHNFDRRIAQRFDAALRHQIAMAGQANGRMSLKDFLLQEAIPYWETRIPLLQGDTEELSAQVGEFFGDLLAAIKVESASALDCVPKVVKALLLDSEQGDLIRRDWTEVTMTRLLHQIGRIRRIGQTNPAFRDKFLLVRDCLFMAVRGDDRTGERIIFDDSPSRPALRGELCHREDGLTLPCDVLYLWSDLLGLCLRIDSARVDPNVQNHVSLREMFASDGDGGRDNCLLDAFVVRIPLPHDRQFQFSVLQSKWRINCDATTICIGANVQHVDGDIGGFEDHVRIAYGHELCPHARFR
jgi:serine/threonine protein kinase